MERLLFGLTVKKRYLILINKLKCLFGYHDKITSEFYDWGDSVYCKRKGCGWVDYNAVNKTVALTMTIELDEHLREVRKV